MNDTVKDGMSDDDAPKFFEDTETRRMAERLRPTITATQAMRAVEQALTPPERPTLNSISAILTARGKIHGDFSNDARTAQRLKGVMRDTVNWAELTDVQHEALEAIATKIGRILSGDPDHADHWSDVQGYARLVEERL